MVKDLLTDEAGIRAAFDEVFDQAIVFHGFADYMRGYVWGVKWQNLYPGMKLVSESHDAERWSRSLGVPFYEAAVETNGHNLQLVRLGWDDEFGALFRAEAEHQVPVAALAASRKVPHRPTDQVAPPA